MNLTYTYTVVSVDESARCMEIMYEAEGFKPARVGARLPYENETLEQIVQMYAPSAIWESFARNVVTPDVGATGAINATATAPDVDPEEVANAQMWEQVNFEGRVAKALVKFGVLSAAPTEIPVENL